MEYINAIFTWLTTIMTTIINIKIIDNITIGKLAFGLFMVFTLFSLTLEYISRKGGN